MLAGYRDAMRHLMATDPGLVRRFPTALHLDDYTPQQLAAIARQTARLRYGLGFAEGLEARTCIVYVLCIVHAVHIVCIKRGVNRCKYGKI